MICGSCRRRCDPDRSFCTNCGSSVFSDERDALSLFGQQVQRLSSSSQASRRLRSFEQSAQSIDRAAVGRAARTMRSRTAAAGKAAQPFRLGPLIKLAVVGFIVWNVASWMLTIPEVFALKERVQAG